jgi:hypothetical protein
MNELKSAIGKGDVFSPTSLRKMKQRDVKVYMRDLLVFGSDEYKRWTVFSCKAYVLTLFYLSLTGGENTLLFLEEIEFLCKIARDEALAAVFPVIGSLILRILWASLQTGDNNEEEYDEVFKLIVEFTRTWCPARFSPFDMAKLYSVSLGNRGDIENLVKRCREDRKFADGFMAMLESPIQREIPLGDNLQSINGVGTYPEGTLCLEVLYKVLFQGGERAEAGTETGTLEAAKAEAKRVSLCVSEGWGDFKLNDGTVLRFSLPDGKVLNLETICALLKNRYKSKSAVVVQVQSHLNAVGKRKRDEEEKVVLKHGLVFTR